MGQVGVVGSCMVDLTFVVAEFPEEGETISTDEFHDGFGGKGANLAVAAARSGANVRIIGAVGDDPFGDDVLNNFRDDHIDSEYVFQIENEGTGLAAIIVNNKGKNEIVGSPRANTSLALSHLDEVDDRWFNLDCIGGVLEIDVEVLTECFRRAHARGEATTVLNAAPALDISEDLWKETDCLVVNETEAAHYAGEQPTRDSFESVLDSLLSRGPREVVLTLGAEGAAYLTQDGDTGTVPAPDLEAVDTTGAGDAFVGRFLSARSDDIPLEESLVKASRYAAETVMKEGTQKSFPDWR